MNPSPIKKQHSRLVIFVLFSLSLWLLTGCAKKNVLNSSEQAEFDSFLNSCFLDYVSRDTVTMHFKLANPSAYGLKESVSPSYGDLSYEAQKKNCKKDKTTLEKLESFDPNALTPSQQFTWEILQNALKNSVASEKYILYQSPLGTNGLQSEIPVTLSEYTFDEETDIKTYLSLVNQVPSLFGQILTFENKRREADITSPDFVISDTIEQIDQFLSASEDNNLLVESFEEKINALNTLSADQKTTYINNNRALVRQVVVPAYKNFRRSLKKYLNAESTQIPQKERLSQYETGCDYYAFLVSAKVGTDLSPEECISALEGTLKDTIADISTLIEENKEIYTDYLSATPKLSDPSVILEELSADTRIDFPDITTTSEPFSDSSVENPLKDSSQNHKTESSSSEESTTHTIPYTLKTVPDALSTTSACAFYLIPPIDDLSENVIYINEARVDGDDLFGTLAHEGYPGHLYQTNYFLSTDPAPIRSLTRCLGYDEGWGTYAQLYSYNYLEFKDTDLETTKQLRRLFQDNDLLSLCLSSLSDLYVNYKNYDENALADYLKDYGISKENVTSLYRYVIENPASYLAYGLGYYEMTQLKENMEENLKEEFTIKEFHKRILDTGSCPFYLLRNELDSISR